MTIEVRCSCGQKLSAKAEAAGRVLKCPICRRPLVVPDIRQEASAGDSNDTGDSPPTNHDLTKSGLGGWARPCQLIFLAFVFSFLQTMVVPPAAILFALAIVLYSVVLLVKRDSQNKLFNALGVADPTKRYAVLGMTNFFTVVTCVTVLLHWESIPDYEVPEYTVIEEIARIDGVKHVDVLIPSYSWDTPIEQRVQVARSIAYLEGYDQGEHTICLFSDRVAHKAQYSSSYAEQHPDHERGYLGSLENGEFSNWYEVERSSAVARDGTLNTESPARPPKNKGEYGDAEVANARPHKWMNDTYNATVRRVEEKVWEEVQNSTGQATYRYQEMAQTDEYTELFCPKRKYEVRVFQDRMELKKGGKWIWVADGHWEPSGTLDKLQVTE